MKKVLALVSMLASTVTLADSDKSNTYAIFGANASKVDFNSSTRSTDNTGFGYKIGAGYDINSSIAVELSYHDYGDVLKYGVNPSTASASQYTFDDTAHFFSLGGVYSLPINNNLSLLAEIGLYRWKSERDYKATAANTNGTPSDYSRSDTDHYYGLGVSYDLGNEYAVRASHSRYKIDIAGPDAYTTGISIVKSF